MLPDLLQDPGEHIEEYPTVAKGATVGPSFMSVEQYWRALAGSGPRIRCPREDTSQAVPM
jgi:hypothetical protein